MKLILASTQDPAAKNIAARLLEFYDFRKFPSLSNSYVSGEVLLVTTKNRISQLSSPPIEAEEIIVASKHESQSSRQTFTTHVPGELEKGELAVASPKTVKSILRELVTARDELELPHEVSLEATHHGPTKLDVPVTFVEIGSAQKHWDDKVAGEAVARAIMNSVSAPKCQNAVGIGGPHYAPHHTEVSLKLDVGVGHIFPKYSGIDTAMIEKAIARTKGGVDLLLLDWKGLNSKQREICQKISEKLNIKTSRVRKSLREKA